MKNRVNKSIWITLSIVLFFLFSCASVQQKQIEPRNADSYRNRGLTYAEKGQYDQAISDFTDALKIDPKDFYAFYYRGIVYMKKGQTDQAISDYTRAIEIDPKYAHAYYNRGAAYGIMGQYDQAISDFTKVSEIDPVNANAYWGRGTAYCRKGQVDLGLLDLNNAKKLDANLKNAVDEEIAQCTGSRAQAEGGLIVHFAYAPEQIRQGDIWKIYLSVTDPKGHMHQAVCRVEQTGESYYKPIIIYLKKGMEEHLVGHFAVYTHNFSELNDFVLAMSILDREGSVLKTFRFPIEFEYSPEPMKPLPSDMEKDLNRRISTIDIDWVLGGI